MQVGKENLVKLLTLYKIIFILMRDDEKYYVELYLYKFLFVAVRRCYTLHENRGEEVFRGAK